ncbi:hypothetical protein QVD17_37541 [Tagetes erecta]|uniref:Uncharacterized protein n=1 Tax=Tagetes erecta TaxID=13708 RepID=A0AAD8JW81_TARER|nr:hypothetical protein QVD17_37541 [Tagetes erecta]
MAAASAVGAPNDNASMVYWIVFIVGRSSEQRCIYDELVNGGGFSRWIVVELGGGGGGGDGGKEYDGGDGGE